MPFFLPAHVERVTATAYCLRGQTASSAYAREGTVAVDQRYVGLGSRLRVIFSPAVADAQVLLSFFERFRKKSFRAEDTGSDIVGRRIDVWMPRCSDALAFGRRLAFVVVEPAR